jgi:mycothiol synthase
MARAKPIPPVTIRSATLADIDAIVALGHAAVDAGDIPGVSHADVEHGGAALVIHPAGALVAELGGAVAGVIVPDQNDLQVAAPYRRQGIGTALVEAVLPVLRGRGEPYLLLHVPAGETAGRRFAEARGFRYRATLHWMERPGSDACPSPSAPDGILLRGFDPAAEDLAALVALMNDAFADHATPVSWTRDEIAARHAQPEFDPAGTLLAADGAHPEHLVGFARASVETRDTGPIGEIHLIGVLPAWRGRGLGRALLRWGIRYLQEGQVPVIGLAVTAANAPALRLYEAHGFRTVLSWPQWSRDV